MITAVEIENFKAFGRRQRIELAPITLIYGENSAGKTSILQALNLLKQTHESRDSGAVLLPRAEQGIVDLGSFNELLFDHDAGRTLRLGVEVKPEDTGSWARAIRAHEFLAEGSVGIHLSFRRTKKSGEITLAELRLSLPGRVDDFAAFGPRALNEDEQQRMLRYGWPAAGSQRVRLRYAGAECTFVSEQREIWEPYYKAWLSRRLEVVKMLGSLVDAGSPRRMALVDEEAQAEEQTWRRQIAEAEAFYQRDFTLDEFQRRMRAWALGSVISMDGFIPNSPIGITRREIPEALLGEFGPLHTRGLRGLPFLDLSRLAFFSGRLLEEALGTLFPMGPFRRPPERWYIFTGTSPIDVGYKGDHLPDLLFRRPELVRSANKWLKRLEIGYELLVRPVGDRDSDLFEVRLLDNRREAQVEVGLADVGFGISQILPFIVQALASQNQCISIEQPEVHIHPRLQADLADLVAEATKPPYGHRFLIETHSEHLVLRLQRLVREKNLTPRDVSVYYVARGPHGSSAVRLRLDDQGDFVDEWPDGFFPERLRELR